MKVKTGLAMGRIRMLKGVVGIVVVCLFASWVSVVSVVQAEPEPAKAPARPVEFSPDSIAANLGISLARAESTHFVVYCAEGGSAAARSCSLRFEKAFVLFCEAMGISKDSKFMKYRFIDVQLGNKSTYNKLVSLIVNDPNGVVGAEWEGVVRRASAFGFSGAHWSYRRGSNMASYFDSLSHGATHNIFNAWVSDFRGDKYTGKEVPYWLYEGMAAYIDWKGHKHCGTSCIAYQSKEDEESNWRDESSTWTAQVRKALRSRRGEGMPKMRKVISAGIQTFDHRMRAMSWSMVRYLVELDRAKGDKKRGKFLAFMKALMNGDRMDKALSEHFKFKDIEAMEKKWARWGKKLKTEEEIEEKKKKKR